MTDFESIRHALSVARERGFAEVAIEDGEIEFKAVLEPTKSSRQKAAEAQLAEDSGEPAAPAFAEVIAPLVGYYKAGSKPLTVGGTVAAGDIVAVIAQLGIANDVESRFAGEVVEVCVEENEPVMFGQVLARIKE